MQGAKRKSTHGWMLLLGVGDGIALLVGFLVKQGCLEYFLAVAVGDDNGILAVLFAPITQIMLKASYNFSVGERSAGMLL